MSILPSYPYRPFPCPHTGTMMGYRDDEELANCQRTSSLHGAQKVLNLAEQKIKTTADRLAAVEKKTLEAIKQYNLCMADEERRLAEAMDHHKRSTTQHILDRERIERDTADEQEGLRRLLAAAEQEKLTAETEQATIRAECIAAAAEKEERRVTAERDRREREIVAAETAMREYHAAAAARAAEVERLRLEAERLRLEKITTLARRISGTSDEAEALLVHFGHRNYKICKKDSLLARQVINRYAAEKSVRYEDAEAILRE